MEAGGAEEVDGDATIDREDNTARRWGDDAMTTLSQEDDDATSTKECIWVKTTADDMIWTYSRDQIQPWSNGGGGCMAIGGGRGSQFGGEAMDQRAHERGSDSHLSVSLARWRLVAGGRV
ncbi:hypothetical protein GUJ93_ZPchr0001g32424 [Zizania palustris]|uniref:Uncharacterized protein n=1 Tax=Zizania palustris TaxID=103762 RepID=A0A8J5RRU1_ZIZPA|nr:hypothetical protein GUJ93_ZPchr0001g32424 [Zizania palustris]